MSSSKSPKLPVETLKEDLAAHRKNDAQQILPDSKISPKDRFRGLLALLIVVMIWVVSNEVMQYFMEGSGKYNKPVVVTTVCAVSFSIFGVRLFDKAERETFWSTCVNHYYCTSAGLFCVLWILANLAFNASLASTSPASAVTLSSTSATFTLLGSIFLRIETFSPRKAVAVVACLVGTAITASVDSEDTEHPREMYGDILAFASAILYSGYLLLFQKAVGNDIPTENFMLLVGIWGILLLPLVPVVEPVSSPGLTGGTIIALNAIIGTAVSERLWLYGSLNCGPTVATLAMSVTIPISAIVDIVRGRLVVGGGRWFVGALLITVGFLLASGSESDKVVGSTTEDGILDAKCGGLSDSTDDLHPVLCTHSTQSSSVSCVSTT
eukprot:m.391054 g.391054  ORF g.391054 m.391054 type:complete len:382 (-) comp21068_c0_seq6:214-1359(-)